MKFEDDDKNPQPTDKPSIDIPKFDPGVQVDRSLDIPNAPVKE